MAGRMRFIARLVSDVLLACHPVCKDESVPMRGPLTLSLITALFRSSQELLQKGLPARLQPGRFSQRQ